MNITAARLLRNVISGVSDQASLMDVLEIKKSRFDEHVRHLVRDGYVRKTRGAVLPQDSPQMDLLARLTKRYDIVVLLKNSNELIFSILTEPHTINQIISHTGLSPSTVHRAVSDLRSIGVIRREPGGARLLSTDRIWLHMDIDILTLSNILRIRREKEPHTEIIFTDSRKTLRRTRHGHRTQGQTTGFTLFTEYGVRYDSPYDYYIEQDRPLDLHDVLIHAVVSAYRVGDRQGLIMAIVFYLKHKNEFDHLVLKRASAEFGASSIWLDIEAYLRGHRLDNPDMFLPRNEFVSKAKMYDIPEKRYSLPRASDRLFKDLGCRLDEKITAYVIGGENMRIKGLKGTTQDIDIVLEDMRDFGLLQDALYSLGYSKIVEMSMSREDQRLYPDEILVDDRGSRVDLFTRRIMRHAILSESMKRGADYTEYGNLRVGLPRNEYVFLLKAIASRDGDVDDMAALVINDSDQPARFRHMEFDWNLVWDELIHQEEMNHVYDFTEYVVHHIELAAGRGAKVPILDKFRMHVTDRMIQTVLRGGMQAQNLVVSILKGTDLSEKTIRNRIDALERRKIIKKNTDGNDVMISLLTNPRFFYREWKVRSDTITDYLNWRFPISKPSGRSMRDFADKLHRLGYETIGMVDDDVIDALDGKRHTDVALMCLQLTADIDGHEFRARR